MAPDEDYGYKLSYNFVDLIVLYEAAIEKQAQLAK